jgi:hypothetical protein
MISHWRPTHTQRVHSLHFVSASTSALPSLPFPPRRALIHFSHAPFFPLSLYLSNMAVLHLLKSSNYLNERALQIRSGTIPFPHVIIHID